MPYQARQLGRYIRNPGGGNGRHLVVTEESTVTHARLRADMGLSTWQPRRGGIFEVKRSWLARKQL